ncbi:MULTISPECIES: hypothetical protein [Rahnella]
MSNEFEPVDDASRPVELDEELECQLLQAPAGRQMLAKLKFNSEE